MGRLPRWAKGAKKVCDRCGVEYQERDGNLRKQGGLWVDRACYDTLTDRQRSISINRRTQ